MNQNEILNALCNSIKFLDDLGKAYNVQNKIIEFEKQNQTQEERIKKCIKRCKMDLEELNTILEQDIKDNQC